MDQLNWRRALAAVSFVSALSVSSMGCAPQAPADADDEEANNQSDALDSSLKCDVSNLKAQACQDALANVRLQANAVGRSEIIERGIDWVNRGITYDESLYFKGYRRDCSGFVSQAWQYKSNPGTALFPPFTNPSQYAYALGGFDDLAPGDAVNRKTRIKNSHGQLVGHVILFAGWASADHQEMYLIQEASPGKPTLFTKTNRNTLGDYIAIRATNAPEPTAPATDPTTAPTPTPTPDPTTTPGCGKLLANQSLGIDQAATSCDGRFALIQQDDGNLVLYQSGGKALWSTTTVGSNAQTTIMQDDGNLVIYGPAGAIWSSQTDKNPGAWLAINDDGSLVIDDANGKPIWWDGTGGL